MCTHNLFTSLSTCIAVAALWLNHGSRHAGPQYRVLTRLDKPDLVPAMGKSKRKRCMKKCRSGTRTSGKGWKRYGIAYSLIKDRAEKAEAQIEAAETRAADAEARAKAAELAAGLAEDAVAADRKRQKAVLAEACRQTIVAAFQEMQGGHFENSHSLLAFLEGRNFFC